MLKLRNRNALLLIGLSFVAISPAGAQVGSSPTIEAGRDINVGGSINFGMTDERAEAFAEAYARGESPAVGELASVSQQSGVANAAIASFFASLGQQNVPPSAMPSSSPPMFRSSRSRTPGWGC